MAGGSQKGGRTTAPQPAENAAEAAFYQLMLDRLAPSQAPPAPQPSFLEAPEVFASAVQCSLVGNDISVILMRPRMLVGLLEGQQTSFVNQLPCAYVMMSIDTAKDLFLSLQDMLSVYEKDFGEIETVYSRKKISEEK